MNEDEEKRKRLEEKNKNAQKKEIVTPDSYNKEKKVGE